MNEERSYEGIGGWLILPLITVFVAPLRAAIVLRRDLLPVFTEGYWFDLTMPGTVTYHPMWAIAIGFEMAGALFGVIFPLILLWLFFRRSRYLPKLYIAFLAVALIHPVADFFLANTIPAVAAREDWGAVGQIIGAAIATLIWVPYFLVSRRVKQTFTR